MVQARACLDLGILERLTLSLGGFRVFYCFCPLSAGVSGQTLDIIVPLGNLPIPLIPGTAALLLPSLQIRTVMSCIHKYIPQIWTLGNISYCISVAESFVERAFVREA